MRIAIDRPSTKSSANLPRSSEGASSAPAAAFPVVTPPTELLALQRLITKGGALSPRSPDTQTNVQREEEKIPISAGDAEKIHLDPRVVLSGQPAPQLDDRSHSATIPIPTEHHGALGLAVSGYIENGYLSRNIYFDIPFDAGVVGRALRKANPLRGTIASEHLSELFAFWQVDSSKGKLTVAKTARVSSQIEFDKGSYVRVTGETNALPDGSYELYMKVAIATPGRVETTPEAGYDITVPLEGKGKAELPKVGGVELTAKPSITRKGSVTSTQVSIAANEAPGTIYRLLLVPAAPQLPAPQAPTTPQGPTSGGSVTNTQDNRVYDSSVRIGTLNINSPAPAQESDKPVVIGLEAQAGAEGRAELTQDERARLNAFKNQFRAQYGDVWLSLLQPQGLAGTKNSLVELTGHASRTATPEINRQVAEERAKLLKDFIQQNWGVHPSRVVAVAVGETEAKGNGPIAEERYVGIRIYGG